MNILHLLVDLLGTVVVGTLFICGVGFLTILVGVTIDRKRVKVLTEEGVRDELERLNERERTIMLNAPDDSSAANWLIRDSKERNVA